MGQQQDGKFTKGPWCFERHNAFGTTFLGEEWPFGYISTSPTPVPIFEIKPIVEWKRSELEANARLLAAAPELYEALAEFQSAMQRFGEWDDGCFYYQGASASEFQNAIRLTDAALAKVTGA